MKDIKIGKFKITKKGILKIAFIFFILGMFIGAYIAAMNSGKQNSFILLSSVIIIPILYMLAPALKKEISIV